MDFERWSQPFSKYAPTALQTTLPEQSASPNTCRAPVCWQQNLSVLLSVSCWILFYIQRQEYDFLKQLFGNNKLNCFGDTHVFFGPECKLHTLILHCQFLLAILITKKYCRATARNKPKIWTGKCCSKGIVQEVFWGVVFCLVGWFFPKRMLENMLL